VPRNTPLNEEEKTGWAERLTRKHGPIASMVAEEYAAAHGKAGRIQVQDAWLEVAATIRSASSEKEEQT
jgi:hypothetical protein